jgi:hypothetical protein
VTPARSPARRAAITLAATVLAVGGFVLGRGLTAPAPIARNSRAAVGTDDVREILSGGLYRNYEGALTQDEADCAANATVDALGPQRFIDLGLGGVNPYGGYSYAELTADEKPAFLTAYLGCIPDDRLAAYRTTIIADNTGISREAAACVAEAELAAVGPGRLRELIVAASAHPDATLAIVARGDEFALLADVTADCGVAEQVHTTALV